MQIGRAVTVIVRQGSCEESAFTADLKNGRHTSELMPADAAQTWRSSPSHRASRQRRTLSRHNESPWWGRPMISPLRSGLPTCDGGTRQDEERRTAK
jgi:hypothetical protein